MAEKFYDLIIIGGGPAGITAGIYAARQRVNTLLITKDFSGQIAKKSVLIENYPGLDGICGKELLEKFESHLRKQKIEILTANVKTVIKPADYFLVSTSDDKIYKSRTLIIATGSDPRPLEAVGEKEFLGRGVSYCVICDGCLFNNKTVVVIGGGNSGLEAAIFLAELASKIYILEYGEKLKAEAENIERVEKIKKVEIIYNAVLKEIKGEQFVNSIVYKDRKSEQLITLPVAGVFVEIGYQPATALVKDLVDFNENDEIKTDVETFQTKTAGLFAAGDVNAGRYKQIITACGEGAKAALAVYEYLHKNNK